MWRKMAQWKGFGSKYECVWMENEDDNDDVQVGLKNEGLE